MIDWATHAVWTRHTHGYMRTFTVNRSQKWCLKKQVDADHDDYQRDHEIMSIVCLPIDPAVSCEGVKR